MGCGLSETVGKFLCSLVDDSDRWTFLRIYQEIPIIETENADLTTIRQQAIPVSPCAEVEPLALLKARGCRVAARLVGYAERKQEETELLPDGYVQYVV